MVETLARLRSFARQFIPPNDEAAYYLSADDPMIENARLLLDVLDDYETLVRDRAPMRTVRTSDTSEPEAVHVL